MSRAIAASAGVRFDESPLPWVQQYIDPSLLRHDLFRSLYYLHIQPPLFNLYLGIVLHLPSRLQRPAFIVTFAAAGLLLALALAELMAELGVPRWWAVALAATFTVGPAAILYENWLFYTLPVASCLTVAALSLLRWVRTDRLVWCAIFAAALGCLGLMRSSYHVVWLAIVVAGVLALHPTNRRRTVPVLLVPLVLVALVYVKNYVVFDYAAASSWEGQTLALATTFRLPANVRTEMVARGELSRYALIEPYSPLSAYSDLLPPARPTRVPVLDRPTKSNGSVNYDDRQFVTVDERYLSDALTVIRRDPSVVPASVKSSLTVMLEPSEDYAFLRPNLARIHPWYVLYADVVEGRMGTRAPSAARYPSSRPGALIALVYVLAAVGGALSLGGIIRRRRMTSPEQLTAVFIAFTLAWTWCESLAADVGENNRFRFEGDPVALALAAATAALLVGKFRARRSRAGRAAPSEVVGQVTAYSPATSCSRTSAP